MSEPERRTIPSLPSQLRAGDTDRDTTTALLSEAVAQGYLTMAEFEQRSTQVLTARTVGELRALEADLPADRIVPGPRTDSHRRPDTVAAPAADPGDRRAARIGLYAHLGSYLAGVGIMLAVWLVVGLVAGAWYFWPIWPILGWGIGVASHAIPVLAGRGGCDTRTRALREARASTGSACE